MTRLALFSIGFLVYTLISALIHAGHPNGYIDERSARIAGLCSTYTKSTDIQAFDRTFGN